jgi:hypothetical protein
MWSATRRIGLTVVLLGLATGPVRAGVITSTSAFSGSASIVNFNAMLSGRYTNTGASFTTGGVTFLSTNSQLYIDQWGGFFNTPGASGGAALNDTVAQSDIWIDFGAAAVNRAGLLLSTGVATTWTVRAYTAGNLIESTTATNTAGAPVFIGFEESQGIDHLRVSEASGNGLITLIDDVRFEAIAAPEPSTMAGALTAALLGLAYARRRWGNFAA